MAFVSFLFFLLAGLGFLGDEASSGGCSSLLLKPFPALCEFGTASGVAVVTAVAGAALISLFLGLLVSCRSFVIGAERRSGATALLLVFTSIFALCGLSFVHLTEGSQFACTAQYILLAVLYFSSLLCLLTQAIRLFLPFFSLPQQDWDPCIRALAVLTVVLAVVQIYIPLEWLAVAMEYRDQLTCRSKPLYIFMPLLCVVVVLSAALSGMVWSQKRGQQHSKRRAGFLLVAWLMTALLWVFRAAYYLYANAGFGIPSNWDNFQQVMVLLVQAWLLLLLHAIPEAHAWLHLPPEPTLPQRINILWAPPQMPPSSFTGAISLSPWQSREPQGSWSDSSSDQSSSFGPGPRAPFRTSSDQSTRITILDEEAMTSTSV